MNLKMMDLKYINFQKFKCFLISAFLFFYGCGIEPLSTNKNNISGNSIVQQSKKFDVKELQEATSKSYKNKILLDKENIDFLGIHFERLQISLSEITYQTENHLPSTVNAIDISYARRVKKSALYHEFRNMLEPISFSLQQPEEGNYLRRVLHSEKKINELDRLTYLKFYEPLWFSRTITDLSNQDLYQMEDEFPYNKQINDANEKILQNDTGLKVHSKLFHLNNNNTSIFDDYYHIGPSFQEIADTTICEQSDNDLNYLDENRCPEIYSDSLYHESLNLSDEHKKFRIHLIEKTIVGGHETFYVPEANGKFSIFMNNTKKISDGYIVDSDKEIDLLKNSNYHIQSYPQNVQLSLTNKDNNIVEITTTSSVNEQFNASITSSNGYSQTENLYNSYISSSPTYTKTIDKRMLKSGEYNYEVFFPFSNTRKNIKFNVDCSTPDILESLDNSFSTKVVVFPPTDTYKPRCENQNNKRFINTCEDVPNSKNKAELINNIQKNLVQQVKDFNKSIPKPKTFTTKSVESDNLKNTIVENLSTISSTKKELQSLVNSIQLSSDSTETEEVNEPDVNIPDPNNENPPSNIEQNKQKLELLTTDFNNALGKVSKANPENIIKAMRVLTQEISLYESIVSQYLSIADTKPKEIIPLIAKVSGRINNHLARINKVSLVQMDETQKQDLANQYNEIYEQVSIYEEYAKAVQSPDNNDDEDDSFQTQGFSIKGNGTTDDISQAAKDQANIQASKAYWKSQQLTPEEEQRAIYVEEALKTAVESASFLYGPPATKTEIAAVALGYLAKESPRMIGYLLKSPTVLEKLTKVKTVIKGLGDSFKLPNGHCLCPAEVSVLSKSPQTAKKFLSQTADKLKNFFKMAGKATWRGKTYIPSGNAKEGWIHIEARHITGTDPGGDLFKAGTTQDMIEKAADLLVKKGNRISDPNKTIQVFEKDIVVNKQKDLVRVIVDSKDGKVITIFPVRGGS